jgi:AraC-like DNA-binding protein
MAGLRFTLFGFYYLFKIPAYHFTDQNFITTDVWGNEMEWLREQLLENPDNEAIFSALHNWILSKMAKADLQQIHQWKKIESQITQPNTPVGELLDKVMGYSHKHSIHLFKEKCGLKPKMIQKVSRFETVSQMLSQKGLSGLDYLSYADQSHLIREFKAFTGYTPVEYLRSKPIVFYQHQHLQDAPYPQA